MKRGLASSRRSAPRSTSARVASAYTSRPKRAASKSANSAIAAIVPAVTSPTPSPSRTSFPSTARSAPARPVRGSVAPSASTSTSSSPTEDGRFAKAPIKPWTTASYSDGQDDLLAFAADGAFPSTDPGASYAAAHRRLVVEGDSDFYGIHGFFEWLERTHLQNAHPRAALEVPELPSLRRLRRRAVPTGTRPPLPSLGQDGRRGLRPRHRARSRVLPRARAARPKTPWRRCC